MIVTHCLGYDCLTWERDGPCQCECSGCCLARISWDPVGGFHTCEGGSVEELLHTVRTIGIMPGDLLVITIPGKISPETSSAIGAAIRNELNLAENKVLILQDGVQATTVSETLQTLNDLLEDAARSVTALAGVIHHRVQHPDPVVSSRDERILNYSIETARLASAYLAHGVGALLDREEKAPDVEEEALASEPRQRGPGLGRDSQGGQALGAGSSDRTAAELT